MKTIILILAFLVIISIQSRADEVSDGIDQLQRNSVASEANLEQYEKNLEIVKKNADQMKLSIDKLRKFLANLELSSQGIQNNQAQLDPVKKRVLGHIKLERNSIAKEQKQIDEVQKVLTKLNTQLESRRLNIKVYQEKLAEIEREREGWKEQSGKMASLLKSVNDKVTTAKVEQNKWQTKEKKYENEVVRWKKQAVLSKKQLRNYKRLQD